MAMDLVESWMGLPGMQGLRVPVFLGREDGTKPPPLADLDAAQHSLIVLLVDSWMTNRVTGGGESWAEWARALFCSASGVDQRYFIPVALSREAFDWDSEVGRYHLLPLFEIADEEERRARLEFSLAVRALQLLSSDKSQVGTSEEAPVTLFVSHAKRDLDPHHQDPVRFSQDALRELPVREWFDAREIREGAEFDRKIREGIQRADAVLIYLTDAWATRPWCRKEALFAKEIGTPVVVIDALEEGEPRSFPYSGNTRLLRWRVSTRPPKDLQEERAWRKQSLIEGKRAVSAGVREAFRRVHIKRRLEGLARTGDVILDFAPEPARLGWESPTATFLYPDPPLGREEQRLLERIWPHSSFETPMTRLAHSRSSQSQGSLAISISESPQLSKLGLTKRHEHLLSDEVHLYLMLAGLQLVYGGKLEPENMHDPNNFTLRLFELARGYSSLASDTGVKIPPIRNIAPWPLWTLYDHDVTNIFGKLTDLEKDPPPDFEFDLDDLEAQSNGFVPWETPLQRYAWARALSQMRQRVTREATARLCMGGNLGGYKGCLPGVLEESLLSLQTRQPLFLAGVLGGATRWVIDHLEDRPSAWRNDEAASKLALRPDWFDLYERYGGEPPVLESLGTRFRSFASRGIAAALANGLDDAENREMFASADPHRIATLVLTGLARLE